MKSQNPKLKLLAVCLWAHWLCSPGDFPIAVRTNRQAATDHTRQHRRASEERSSWRMLGSLADTLPSLRPNEAAVASDPEPKTGSVPIDSKSDNTIRTAVADSDAPDSAAGTEPAHDSGKVEPADLSENRFANLLSDSDSESESANSSSGTATANVQATAGGFSLAPASFGASAYAASLVAVKKPDLMTSTFGDMSTLIGALGRAEESVADASEEQREGGSSRNWDLSGLHDATVNVVPKRQRYNPLYGKSIAEHERDVIKLQEGLQNSKRQMKMQNQRRKKMKQQSRKSNSRKSAKQARGEAAAAKYAKRLNNRGGRKRRNRSGRNARAKPY